MDVSRELVMVGMPSCWISYTTTLPLTYPDHEMTQQSLNVKVLLQAQMPSIQTLRNTRS